MKARVKATGEIVEVQDFNGNMYVEKFGEVSGRLFHITELDFDNLDTPDYWARLEHQAAIAAMQGLVTRGEVLGSSVQEIARDIAEISCEIAHTLVEKMKEERK